MIVLRRDTVLLMILVAAMPALAEVVTPAWGPTGTAGQIDASIPDFSGIWAHLSWPDFEQPPAGPGPVKNLSRRNGVSNLGQLVGDYNNPILKPDAAAVVKKHGDISLRGVPYPTPSNHCWPGGVPFVIWNIGMQLVQEPGKITILYSNDHEVRRVRLNGSHPTRVTPSWYGDSIARYEGDTLVIDTVGVKPGPYAMVDMYGTPFSPALHVIERYRLLDYDATIASENRGQQGNLRLQSSDPGFAPYPAYRGNGLQVVFTVEDDGVFTMPWSAAVTYRRPLSPLGEWPESVCAENPDGYFPGKTDLPIATKPDF
jgi:hypothetical protein